MSATDGAENGCPDKFAPNLVPRTIRGLAARLTLALAATLACGLPGAASAHEIPNDVTIQAFVKADDGRLRLLVRLPMEAMQDIDFPVFGPGYLDIANADEQLRNAAVLWVANDVELFEEGEPLGQLELTAFRASIPSDRSFTAYDSALDHVLSPRLPNDIGLVWQQAMLDLLFEVPIESATSRFSIRPSLERLGLQVVTVIRFVTPDGGIRMFEIDGEAGLVQLDPRWHQAALRFVRSGFGHILEGIDHLLFVLCLVIPFRRSVRSLIWIVTAFTVAHSITLAMTAYGLAPEALWFPPFIETLIAASIFYMALENLFGASLRRRWLIAFGFGLIHGFGFAFALRETLQFAGTHMLTSLLSFNIGVELGQILILLLFIGVLNVLFRVVRQERMGIIVLSVLIGHASWHWMTERFAVLTEFPIGWRDVVAAVSDTGLGWLAVALILAGLAYAVRRQIVGRRALL